MNENPIRSIYNHIQRERRAFETYQNVIAFEAHLMD